MVWRSWDHRTQDCVTVRLGEIEMNIVASSPYVQVRNSLFETADHSRKRTWAGTGCAREKENATPRQKARVLEVQGWQSDFRLNTKSIFADHGQMRDEALGHLFCDIVAGGQVLRDVNYRLLVKISRTLQWPLHLPKLPLRDVKSTGSNGSGKVGRLLSPTGSVMQNA